MKKEMLVSLGLIINEDKILLTQRKGVPLIWELPGGKVERYESPSEAAIREVKEETGYEVELVSKLPFSYLITANDYLKIVILCFECRLIGGELLVAEKEVDAVSWFPTDNLPKIRLGSKEFIDYYLEENNKTDGITVYKIIE